MNDKKQILLLQRINAAFGNLCYSLPGGKIEQGETARKALMREAHEELGITLNPDRVSLIHVIHRKGTDSEFFAHIFQISEWEGELRNREPDRHSALEWFASDALPMPMLPAHSNALHLIQQGIAYSEHGW